MVESAGLHEAGKGVRVGGIVVFVGVGVEVDGMGVLVSGSWVFVGSAGEVSSVAFPQAGKTTIMMPMITRPF
jgi:hypothetical protein